MPACFGGEAGGAFEVFASLEGGNAFDIELLGALSVDVAELVVQRECLGAIILRVVEVARWGRELHDGVHGWGDRGRHGVDVVGCFCGWVEVDKPETCVWVMLEGHEVIVGAQVDASAFLFHNDGVTAF